LSFNGAAAGRENQNKKTNSHKQKMKTYIVTLHGEPVTRINNDSDGKPDVHTGCRADAIEYTQPEAREVAEWIGDGAEVEQTAAKFLAVVIEDGSGDTQHEFATYQDAGAFARDYLGDYVTQEYLGSREPRRKGYTRVACFREQENELFVAILKQD
jgi:hypothetical protein